MYTVSKGPSKIVAKTRRGLGQKLEALDTIRDLSRKSSDSEEIESPTETASSPRPVFNLVRSKKSAHRYPQKSAISPQHEQLVKYIYEAWLRVDQDLCTKQGNDSGSPRRITLYDELIPTPAIQDFEPFDLEGWWGRRLYHTLTQSS